MRVKGWISAPGRCRSARPRRRARPSDERRRRGHIEVVAAAADARRLLDRPFDAAAAEGAEVLGQLVRVRQDQVPDVFPGGNDAAGGHRQRLFDRLEQAIDRIGRQVRQVGRIDSRQEHVAQVVEHHAAGTAGHQLQRGRLDPPGGDDEVVALQARRLVDRPGGMLAADIGQVGGHEARHAVHSRAPPPVSRPASSCRSANPTAADTRSADRSSAERAGNGR